MHPLHSVPKYKYKLKIGSQIRSTTWIKLHKPKM